MAVTPDPSSDPETVPLGLLRRYLTAIGWPLPPITYLSALPDAQSMIARAVLEGRTGGQRHFEKFVLSEKNLEDVEAILPRERGGADYLRQIRTALRTLSDLEGGRSTRSSAISA